MVPTGQLWAQKLESRVIWRLVQRWVIVVLTAAAGLVWAGALPSDVSADDAFDAGDCWQTGVPLQCAAGYSQGNYYYYRVNTAWSGTAYESEGSASLAAAKTSWSNSPGPQWFVDSSNSSAPYMSVYTWTYPTYQTADSIFNTALANGAVAVTVNWKWNGSSYQICYSYACSISFSEVYVNTNVRSQCGSGSWSAFTWQYIFAHEFGHSQGLADHGSGNILMNNVWSSGNYPCIPNTSANGPTSTESGTPVSGGASSCGSPKGIRCIFKWPT